MYAPPLNHEQEKLRGCGKAVWRGTGRAGTGDLSTDSELHKQNSYSFRSRFENEKGTNPEELIAAARWRCTTVAWHATSGHAGYTPTS